jgi:single-stranded-DNA-specific exonuclease
MELPKPPPKSWKTGSRDHKTEQVLVDKLNISPLTAAVLAQRGFADPDKAYSFLNPSLDDLYAPNLLPDYDEAVKAILGARERGETIYIHGDYDVDGVTSTALLTRFLTKIGCKVIPHVPHRMKEGYGIHMDAVGWAKEQGADLFLTCDCGVSALEQLDAVYEAGMKAVVTDHHELHDTLPKAEAVVNPHRKGSKYPFPEISGAGVVFKLCAGITEELQHKKEHFYRAYLDLAVLGTVADVMPLVDENRIIARHGLQQLTVSKKAGIKALLGVSNLIGEKLTSRHIGFQMGPRINAVGRIDDAAIALDLLLTDNREQAESIAQRMNDLNEDRKTQQREMIEAAVIQVMDQGLHEESVIVAANRGWHPGIIGIVAGRLVEMFWKPAFVVAIGEDGVGKGSARSIPNFHLANALGSVEGWILGGGGHEMAAGFSLKEESIDGFRQALSTRANEVLSDEDRMPTLQIDAEVTGTEADRKATEEMELLEPFGEGNPQPRFLCREANFERVLPMQRHPQHARLQLSTGDALRDGIIFNQAEEATAVKGSPVDLVFKPELNTYNGNTTFRWNIEDLRNSSDSDVEPTSTVTS